MSRYKYLATLCLGALLSSLSSCQKSAEDFPVRAYNANSTQVDNLLLKGTDDAEGTLLTQLDHPVDKPTRITYSVAPALLAHYQAIYHPSEPLELLGQEYYEIADPVALIPQGGVKASEVRVRFRGLAALDRDKLYLLPVQASSSDVELLASQSVHYFLLKGAALINVVAGGKENYFGFANTASHPNLNGMTQMTAEALIRVDKFGRLISTIMGREGIFLLRIGDAGVPDDQLQIATSNGNVTDPSWTIETGKWVHIAMTLNGSQLAVYINGVKKGGDKRSPVSSVNWDATGDRGFYIGYSYARDRYLDGDFAECRVWNRALSAEEIQSKDHFYSVDPASPGLVAYWKFNEGTGATIKDATANRYDLRSSSPIKWTEVELPAKN